MLIDSPLLISDCVWTAEWTCEPIGRQYKRRLLMMRHMPYKVQTQVSIINLNFVSELLGTQLVLLLNVSFAQSVCFSFPLVLLFLPFVNRAQSVLH